MFISLLIRGQSLKRTSKQDTLGKKLFPSESLNSHKHRAAGCCFTPRPCLSPGSEWLEIKGWGFICAVGDDVIGTVPSAPWVVAVLGITSAHMLAELIEHVSALWL